MACGRARGTSGTQCRARREGELHAQQSPSTLVMAHHGASPRPRVSLGFARRQDEVFGERQALLEPVGSTRSCTDGWGTYV